MVGPGFGEVILLMLLYPLAAMLGAVMIGAGIALGLRWGGKWLLKVIYSDPEFEKWLRQVINTSEKSDQ